MLGTWAQPRRALIVAIGCLAIALSGVGSVSLLRHSGTASAATPQITFETPRLADPIHSYGEPDIGITPNRPPFVLQPSDQTTGDVYISGPTGTGTQRSIWQGSVDGGHTFRNISRSTQVSVDTTACNPPGVPPVCGPRAAPGGGDTEINFDHTGKQYFADLYALACQHTATRIVDPGTHQESVAESSAVGGCPVPGSDRQWFLVRDPNLQYGPGPAPTGAGAPLIYMETNTVAGCGSNGGGGWYRGTDGLTYVSAILGQNGGAANTFCPFGADGYPSIDQQSQKVFEAEFGTVNNAPAMVLNIGTPVDPAGNLCFLDDPQAACSALPHGLITIATNNPALKDVVNDTSEAANFVVSSLDRGRNLWVAWVNHAADPKQHQAWVSVASASSGWKTWATPVRVSSPPSSVSIFPWIQAGDAGRADVAWYGDATSATPSDTAAHHVWDVYMSQVVFPASGQSVDVAGTPSVTQVKVTPHPMDLEDVCLAGSTCIANFGNRNLADFFEIRADNTGAAMIVYDDISNGLCQAAFGCPGNQSGDHAGAELVTIARQASGPGIYDDPQTGAPMDVSGPSNAPVSGLADASGDALFPLFGSTNVSQMDVLDNRIATSGRTLTITTKVAGDPRDAAGASGAAGCGGCQVQFVTRWQMGIGLYYGMFESGTATGNAFYAGSSQTIDDCSISACDPHVVTYPDLTGSTENGTVECPPNPSAASPCTITERINLADIGNPTNTSLLESVGSYSFTSSVPQSLLNQTTERNDNGATEIDGVCCYNFGVAGVTAPPPPPGSNIPLPNTNQATPVFGGLLVAFVAIPLLVDQLSRRRRRRTR